MKEYWTHEYNDIYDGVVFKIKQINAIELLNLVMTNLELKGSKISQKQEFMQECLKHIIWTKNGMDWYELIDYEGRARLPELDTNPSIAFDLYSIFSTDVLTPVFYESKTFQNLTKADTQKKRRS